MRNNQKLAYSRREVAELLGLHLNTVDRHIRQGVLPARKLGKRWLIPAAVLHAWLEGQDRDKDKNNPAGAGGER